MWAYIEFHTYRARLMAGTRGVPEGTRPVTPVKYPLGTGDDRKRVSDTNNYRTDGCSFRPAITKLCSNLWSH